MTNKLLNVAVATTSVGTIEAVQQIEIPTDSGTQETLKMILQLIITIASLVGLFKKKQPITTK